MIDKIVEIFGLYAQDWGYLIIFLVAFCENSIFLGAIAPGEVMALLAGFYASLGVLDWKLALMLIFVGSVLGDNLGFILGRRLGKSWLQKIGHLFGYREAKIERAESFWSEHGGNSVFFGRFMAVARTFVPFLAGASKLKHSKFFLYDLAGGFIWSASHIALGYFFGKNWKTLEQVVGQFGIVLFIIFMVIFYRYLVRKGIQKN